MATANHHHARPHSTARRAHPRLSKWLRRARRAEGIVERHWPFAAYSLATLATAGYVLSQLARIV
jgi:hypothetical protein